MRLIATVILLFGMITHAIAERQYYLTWGPPAGVDPATVLYRIYSAPPTHERFTLENFRATAQVNTLLGNETWFPVPPPNKDWDYGVQAVIKGTAISSEVEMTHIAVPKPGAAGAWPDEQ